MDYDNNRSNQIFMRRTAEQIPIYPEEEKKEGGEKKREAQKEKKEMIDYLIGLKNLLTDKKAEVACFTDKRKRKELKKEIKEIGEEIKKLEKFIEFCEEAGDELEIVSE